MRKMEDVHDDDDDDDGVTHVDETHVDDEEIIEHHLIEQGYESIYVVAIMGKVVEKYYLAIAHEQLCGEEITHHKIR
jgi:hypothetical protein